MLLICAGVRTDGFPVLPDISLLLPLEESLMFSVLLPQHEKVTIAIPMHLLHNKYPGNLGMTRLSLNLLSYLPPIEETMSTFFYFNII